MNVIAMNKWLVIEPIEDAGKSGALYIPGAINGAYKLAKVLDVAYDADCAQDIDPSHMLKALNSDAGVGYEERIQLPTRKGLQIGETIVYDSLGSVEVRINDKKVHFVKANQVMGVLR